MNNVNIDDKILNIKIAIVIFRIMYILLFILSVFMLLGGDDGKAACIGFGVFGFIIVIINLLLKSYMNKLKKIIDEQNLEYQERAKEIMEERQKMADDFNKNINCEIDESKIKLSELDRERIIKNCNIMKNKNLPYNENMKLIPFNEVVKIKTKEEIVHQMISEFIIAQKAINRLNGISDVQDLDFVQIVSKYQPSQNVLAMLSQISKGEVDEFSLNQLAYLYERVNVYLWILGLGDKPRQDKECNYIMTGYTIYKFNNMDELLSNCKMKSNEEIMEFADLITRYEWAMIELNRNGQKSKNINNDSVIEQKKAIDFVTSFDSNMLLKLSNR